MSWTSEELAANLARTIARFEVEEMGVRPADVKVLVQDELVMVHVKDVLSPSERALARTEPGQAVLQRFNAMLFAGGSSPSVREQVARALNREVIDVQTTLSALTGSLVAVFSLGGPLRA